MKIPSLLSWPATAWFLCLWVLAGGCSDTNSGPEGSTVRDSAGIRIVETKWPDKPPDLAWEVRNTPKINFGVTEGNIQYVFSRVVSAVFLPDGNVAVLDVGMGNIRVYSDEGEYLSGGGQPGEGPGEFLSPKSMVLLPPDSLLVFDDRLQRVSVFDSQARFIRSQPVFRVGHEPLSTAHLLPDGTVLVPTGWSSQALLARRERASGMYRDSLPVFRFFETGAVKDTVGLFPGMEISVNFSTDGVSFRLPPFGGVTSFLVRDSVLVVGTGDEMEVEFYSVEGRMLRIARIVGFDLELTPAEIQEFRDSQLLSAKTPEARRAVEDRLNSVQFPARKPAFVRMRIDEKGNVWLGRYRPPPGTPYDWLVFSWDGIPVGRVELPKQFSLLDIRSHLLLGRWTDELGVQSIRIYELEK